MAVGIHSGVYLCRFYYALGVDDGRSSLEEDETGTISIAVYGCAWVVNAMSTCCVLIALFFVVFCKLKKTFSSLRRDEKSKRGVKRDKQIVMDMVMSLSVHQSG